MDCALVGNAMCWRKVCRSDEVNVTSPRLANNTIRETQHWHLAEAGLYSSAFAHVRSHLVVGSRHGCKEALLRICSMT